MPPRAPWAEEPASLGWDSRAMGTVTLQRWHQRNLPAGCDGVVREPCRCCQGGGGGSSELLLPKQHRPGLGLRIRCSLSPTSSPTICFPQTTSLPPPKMCGQCRRLLGEAQPSGPGTCPVAALPLPCCQGTGCIISLYNSFWLHFGTTVVMGGCGKELVVMPRTSVASSHLPALSRILGLPLPWRISGRWVSLVTCCFTRV